MSSLKLGPCTEGDDRHDFIVYDPEGEKGGAAAQRERVGKILQKVASLEVNLARSSEVRRGSAKDIHKEEISETS